MTAGESDDEFALLADAAEEKHLPWPVPVRRVQCDFAGSRLSGLRWRAGDPEVVFLHGGGLNAHAWDELLLRHPLRALALDLPGHGRSSWFDEPLYLPRALAASLAPVLGRVAPSARTIVAHSVAGLASIVLAAEHPQLLDRLVLVDASPASTAERSAEVLRQVGRTEFNSFDELVEHTLEGRPQPPSDLTSLRRALLHNAYRRGDGRWVWRHDGRRHSTLDRWELMFDELPGLWEAVAAIRCPVLLVRGRRSPILLPEDVARYGNLLPQLRVVELDSGHNVHASRPQELGAAIIAFIAETGQALPPPISS